MESIQHLQYPVQSGFNAASTTDEVIAGIDLTGKTAIVTGGYAGIGLETVKTFVRAGAQVIVPARDLAKAQANLKGVERVTIETMDLINPSSIIAFASKFLALNNPLHILVNNAGIMWTPLQRDARGYESQFATNHLGHFLLTVHLWPALKNAHGARVVNLSSRGHFASPVHFEDPNYEHRPYDPQTAYGQSKTANILFSVELNKRAQAYNVRSYSVHPGAIVDTDLKRTMSMEKLIEMGVVDKDGNPVHDISRGLKTVAQGAATSVWCATNPILEDKGGVYCEDNNIAALHTGGQDVSDSVNRTRFNAKGVMEYAINETNAKKLWTLSEQLTNSSFNL
ncbi:oxidoreductase [Niastella yeongjuensis]|uniref:Oxidoreductase n=1 Tax=Niastella yeongjuensis TaxID=354355 RepID=A0A1V9EEA3_9BACT|nr:SDR family NAD(P)-dependent oxidoreductase [Niastella yeongjuensis]OQP44458.1 oxidoreductase [Niastella yeongjuensis]SEO87007.1 NAD(P)-dependent dehydrogenase, short-chain alcohol dehydrogenase family [Niastella yeongjuensis]